MGVVNDPPPDRVGPVLAEENVLGGGHPFLQSGRQKKRLERRSGLEDIGDVSILEEVGRVGGKAVGIKRGLPGHGQDLPRFRIHDDRHASFGRSPLNGLFQLLFDDVLDVSVEGKNCLAALLRLAHARVLRRDGAAEGVFGNQDVPRFALEEFVIAQLDSFQPLGIKTGETDHLRPHVQLRVKPFGFLQEIHPLEIVFFDGGALLGGDAPFQPDKRLFFFQFFQHRLRLLA